MTTENETLQDVIARLEALEQEVTNLQNAVATVTDRDLPLLTATVRAMMAADIDTIEDLPATGTQFHQRVEQLATTVEDLDERVAGLGDVGTEKTTKDQKYAAVLAFAQQKAGTTQSKVAVTAPEIKGCVGVSRRYAYELIDAMASDIDGVQVRDPTHVETATGTKRKQKAALVDCEVVHASTDGVNSFTTGGDGTSST